MKKFNFNIFISVVILLFFCQINVLAGEKLIILHTNDIHGRLAPLRYSDSLIDVGGQARRNALIQKIRNENKNVLVLDAGDCSQGSLYYVFYGSKPNMQYMNLAGYDAAAIGNHEFDRGINDFQDFAQTAKFPFLASNIRFEKHKEANDLIKSYIIKSFNGFNVGIIGVTTPQIEMLTKVSKDIKTITPEQSIKKSMKKMRKQVDYTVVLSHMGDKEDTRIAKKLKNIDLIVGGHSHCFIKKPRVTEYKNNKTLVVQDGEWGINVGKLTLEFDDNKKLKNYNYELIPITKDIKDDKVIAESIACLDKEITKKTKEVLTKLNQPLDARRSLLVNRQNPAGQLLVKAIKAKYPQAEAVLQNNAGIRANKIFYDQLTLGDILELYPFDNTVILVKVSGKEIKSVLETSSKALPTGDSYYLQSYGITYNVDIIKSPQVLSDNGKKIIKQGDRVSSIKIDGKSLNLKKEYLLAINDYMASGGDGYSQFKKSLKNTNTGDYTRDIIIEYIKKNSPLMVEGQEKNSIKNYNIAN